MKKLIFVLILSLIGKLGTTQNLDNPTNNPILQDVYNSLTIPSSAPVEPLILDLYHIDVLTGATNPLPYLQFKINSDGTITTYKYNSNGTINPLPENKIKVEKDKIKIYEVIPNTGVINGLPSQIIKIK